MSKWKKSFELDFEERDSRQPVAIRAKLSDHYLYQDVFGRFFFDACPSPSEHLMALAEEGDDRRRCQSSIEHLLPKQWHGKLGTWEISIKFTPHEEKNDAA